MASDQDRAWRARVRSFGTGMRFVYPHGTGRISVTGRECGLDCAHCGKRYISSMIPAEALSRNEIRAREYGSYLVSGGCDGAGRVPFWWHRDLLRRLKAHARLNMHVGIVDESDVAEVGALADAVSFDFVVDDGTIGEVYGTARTGHDYVRAYRLLRKATRAFPHVCIGLRGGKICGEYAALDALKAEGAEAIVFLVFIPTPGTRYADRSPPEPEVVAEVICRARLEFPDTPIYLGCMRPGGSYRAQLDQMAVRSGVNAIVVPARQAIRLAGELGLAIEKQTECCVL